jgi:hypothetical protein
MTYEKEIEILRLTNDGDSLMDWQLSIIQSSVNGGLNDNGKKAIDKLYELVKSGENYRYTSSGFLKKFDICESESIQDHPYDVVEELDYDCQGYILWKGKSVEHFKNPEDPKQIPSLWEIVKRCQHLEEIGVPVDTSTVIWCSDWYKDMEKNCPYKDFFLSLYAWFIHPDGQTVIVTDDIKSEGFLLYTQQNKEWQKTVFTEESPELHQQMREQGFSNIDAGQGEDMGLCYASFQSIMKLIEFYEVPSDLIKLS